MVMVYVTVFEMRQPDVLMPVTLVQMTDLGRKEVVDQNSEL